MFNSFDLINRNRNKCKFSNLLEDNSSVEIFSSQLRLPRFKPFRIGSDTNTNNKSTRMLRDRNHHSWSPLSSTHLLPLDFNRFPSHQTRCNGDDTFGNGNQNAERGTIWAIRESVNLTQWYNELNLKWNNALAAHLRWSKRTQSSLIKSLPQLDEEVLHICGSFMIRSATHPRMRVWLTNFLLITTFQRVVLSCATKTHLQLLVERRMGTIHWPHECLSVVDFALIIIQKLATNKSCASFWH